MSLSMSPLHAESDADLVSVHLPVVDDRQWIVGGDRADHQKAWNRSIVRKAQQAGKLRVGPAPLERPSSAR